MYLEVGGLGLGEGRINEYGGWIVLTLIHEWRYTYVEGYIQTRDSRTIIHYSSSIMV